MKIGCGGVRETRAMRAPRTLAPGRLHLHFAPLVAARSAALGIARLGHGVTRTWNGGGAAGPAWLTAANWSVDALPAGTDEAEFAMLGTAPGIGINMNGATNNGPNNQAIGRIVMTGGISRAIGNSST